ncbi:MAG: hypothetical protein ACRDSR_27585 [Pseudonocardiaceae bacterium]
MLTGVDHYARSLARLSDGGREPGWAPTLDPGADRVRANLDALRHVLLRHIDQAIIGFATDLRPRDEAAETGPDRQVP